MGKHTVAEAERHFEDLVARAERGEEVIITRDGRYFGVPCSHSANLSAVSGREIR